MLQLKMTTTTTSTSPTSNKVLEETVKGTSHELSTDFSKKDITLV